MAMRKVTDELPAVDGMECLTFCDRPSSPYPWRVQRWLAARNCWEGEWDTYGKGKGRRWITHWQPIEELNPTKERQP